MAGLKHIAVRLKRFADSEVAFAYKETHVHKRKLIDANIEKRDPALRNITEALHERGLDYVVDGCRLFWLQIEDGNSLAYYEEKNEVECVFDSDWLEEQKTRIRYYQGMQYVNECYRLAEAFDLKDQGRAIDYTYERTK